MALSDYLFVVLQKKDVIVDYNTAKNNKDN